MPFCAFSIVEFNLVNILKWINLKNTWRLLKDLTFSVPLFSLSYFRCPWLPWRTQRKAISFSNPQHKPDFLLIQFHSGKGRITESKFRRYQPTSMPIYTQSPSDFPATHVWWFIAWWDCIENSRKKEASVGAWADNSSKEIWVKRRSSLNKPLRSARKLMGPQGSCQIGFRNGRTDGISILYRSLRENNIDTLCENRTSAGKFEINTDKRREEHKEKSLWCSECDDRHWQTPKKEQKNCNGWSQTASL